MTSTQQGIFSFKSIQFLTQLEHEWTTQPFTEVITTEKTKCPDSHPNELYYDLFEGTEQVCDCSNRHNRITYGAETVNCDTRPKGSKKNPKGKDEGPGLKGDACVRHLAKPPVVLG